MAALCRTVTAPLIHLLEAVNLSKPVEWLLSVKLNGERERIITMITVSEWGTTSSRGYSAPCATGSVVSVRWSGRGKKKKKRTSQKSQFVASTSQLREQRRLTFLSPPRGAEWRTTATLEGHFAIAPLPGSRPHRCRLVGSEI